MPSSGEGSALDAVDEDILAVIERSGGATVSWLARRLGWSKSMVWKRVKRLEAHGLLVAERQGGVILYRVAGPPRPGGILKLGILRASEYPYILGLHHRLSDRYNVKILVYDEAFKLAVDLARGRVHAAMVPAVTSMLIYRASGGAVRIVGGGSSGGAGIVEGDGDGGHATTMASTMELCAEQADLPGPRVYAGSGGEILRLVGEGKVRYGVMWEPYLSQASEAGLKVRECSVPVCCLLTVHRSMEGEADRLSRLMAESVTEAKRGAVDLDVYSSIVGLDASLVKMTAPRYQLLEEPPIDNIKKAWPFISRAAMPPETPEMAIYIQGNKG